MYLSFIDDGETMGMAGISGFIWTCLQIQFVYISFLVSNKGPLHHFDMAVNPPKVYHSFPGPINSTAKQTQNDTAAHHILRSVFNCSLIQNPRAAISVFVGEFAKPGSCQRKKNCGDHIKTAVANER